MILCLTPISHIPNVKDNLSIIAKTTYVPDPTKNEALDVITSEKPISLFVNPNKQAFKIDQELLKNTSVRVIATASTGTDHIDKDFCNQAGIEILSLTKDLEIIRRISSTAELAFSLTLAIVRNMHLAFDSVRDGHWDYEPFVGRQMDHLTIGIIGYGRLGKMYAKYCKAFGSKVMLCDPYVLGNKSYDIADIFRHSDIVAIHVHHTDKTHKMIGDNLFNYIGKNGLYLVNTSRGGIVDEHAVVQALKDKKILGYATDVLYDEQGDIQNSPILRSMKDGANILVTPHIGGMSIEAQEIAYNSVVDKLRNWYATNVNSA